METNHYLITNISQFSGDKESINKLRQYLDDIETVFMTIEEVFGERWEDSKINIELKNKGGGALYRCRGNYHLVEIGIQNEAIQKKTFPENLWGCLFHETHHAFMNPIVYHQSANKDFNGGYTKEPFIRAFQAMVYKRLYEKNMINEKICEQFLNTLEEGARDGKSLFKEYCDIFSKNSSNFSNFISYVKSSDILFTKSSNFRDDLDAVKNYLLKLNNY
jgi:hypothetical protein